MGRKAANELVLSDTEKESLMALMKKGEPGQALALRASIVLACAAGLSNKVVAEKLHITQQTVGKWRVRFAEHRLDGLTDAPRTGAPSSINDSLVQAVIAQTQGCMSQGVHLSSRALAQEVGVSQATVLRIWRASGLNLRHRETTQLSSNLQPRENSRPTGSKNSVNGNTSPGSARDQGLAKRPKQGDLSDTPTQEFIDEHQAASGESKTKIPQTRGRKRELSAEQSQQVFKTMCDERPDSEHLNLGPPLWGISAVSQLIKKDYGLSFDRRTVTRYLERWGIIAEHPFEVGLGKRRPAFTQWAYSVYRGIEVRVEKEQEDIFWFFEEDICPDNNPSAENLQLIEGVPLGSHKLLSVIQGLLRISNMSSMYPLDFLPIQPDDPWIALPTPIALNTSASWLILQDHDSTERMQKLLNALVKLSETSGRKVFLLFPDDKLNSMKELSPWLASVSAHVEVFALPSFRAAPIGAATTL